MQRSGVRLSSLPPAFQPALNNRDNAAGRKSGCSLEKLTPTLQRYALGAGGGRSRAGQTDSKFILRCEPSQKGLFPEWPQRHKPRVVRPPRPKGLPSASQISNSPSTRSGPLGLMVIFAGILPILADCLNAIINPNASIADRSRRGAVRACAGSVASHSGKNG